VKNKEKNLKKLLFILLIAFFVGCFLGYHQDNKQMDTKALRENAALHSASTKKETLGITNKNGVTLVKNVPLLQQKPELDRGCEVTSLAMVLQHAGVDVEKMELAERIKKVDTPYKNENGIYYYGNPNDGFVGDIYTFDKMGYGVYHQPVADLAEEYLPGRIKDLTGKKFDDVLSYVAKGKPVWIIINSDFKKLPASEFRTWNTPSGQVDITWKEHSVVITGFEKDYIYINDPLHSKKNRKLPRVEFIKAWKQMGSQAITYK
jgi:uncharacterized protein YvpB